MDSKHLQDSLCDLHSPALGIRSTGMVALSHDERKQWAKKKIQPAQFDNYKTPLSHLTTDRKLIYSLPQEIIQSKSARQLSTEGKVNQRLGSLALLSVGRYHLRLL